MSNWNHFEKMCKNFNYHPGVKAGSFHQEVFTVKLLGVCNVPPTPKNTVGLCSWGRVTTNPVRDKGTVSKLNPVVWKWWNSRNGRWQVTSWVKLIKKGLHGGEGSIQEVCTCVQEPLVTGILQTGGREPPKHPTGATETELKSPVKMSQEDWACDAINIL